MNPNNDYDCFIRRHGQTWTRGRAHHRRALEAFLSSQEGQPQPEAEGPGHRISVPHTDGGDFVAFFRRVNSALYQYTDEYGQIVQIMMSTGSHAAFINRIVS